MNIFHRNFEKLEDEAAKKEQMDLELKKLRNENLSKKDIAAICIAMFQVILPFALGIVIIYFFIIEFLTKIWVK